MNLKQQVVNLELSKRLRELGVKQESLFYWIKTCMGAFITNNIKKYLTECDCKTLYYIAKDNPNENELYSSFTASELLELLPAAIDRNPIEILKTWYSDKYRVSIANGGIKIEEYNLCDSLAKMLIHLIENNLMEIK